MGRLWFCLFLVAHLGTIGYLYSVRSEEANIPLSNLPNAIAIGIDKRFPEAVVLKATEEHENGKTWFELTLRVGDNVFDVTTAPDGSIAELEKKIAIERLPKVVTDAIARMFRNSNIRMAEEITRSSGQQDQFESYEIIVTQGAGIGN